MRTKTGPTRTHGKSTQRDHTSCHKRQEFPPLAKHGSQHPPGTRKPPASMATDIPNIACPPPTPLKTNSSHTPEMTESFCNRLVMTLDTFHNLMLQMSSLGLRFVKLFLHKTKGKVLPHNFQETRK